MAVEAGEYGAAREVAARLRSASTDSSERLTNSEQGAELIDAYLLFLEEGDAGVFSSSDLVQDHLNYSQVWIAAGRGDGERVNAAFYGSYSGFRRLFRPVWSARFRSSGDNVLPGARWTSRGLLHDHSPLRELAAYSWDTQVARALGDDEWLSEVEPPRERLREAFMRRDLAIPLAVLERL